MAIIRNNAIVINSMTGQYTNSVWIIFSIDVSVEYIRIFIISRYLSNASQKQAHNGLPLAPFTDMV